MKIRNGFVSNSSSSSFVIAIKGDIIDISNIIVSEGPLKNVTIAIAKDIIKNSEEITIKNLIEHNYGGCKNEEDLRNSYYYDNYIKHIDNGFRVFEYNVSNEDESVGSIFMYVDLNYDSETLIIKRDE